jgi:hypothetical protein
MILLGLISLALLTVTIKALIFRHKMETALLVLPVATMIAFAQLRGSMPYAPAGFGTFAHMLFCPSSGTDDSLCLRKGTNIG